MQPLSPKERQIWAMMQRNVPRTRMRREADMTRVCLNVHICNIRKKLGIVWVRKPAPLVSIESAALKARQQMPPVPYAFLAERFGETAARVRSAVFRARRKMGAG